MSRHARVIDLLSDIADDIRDFLDDEVVDRGRDTERDLRRAGRRWTDDDRRSRRAQEELDELREAIGALAQRVDSLANGQVSAASAPAASAPAGEPTDPKAAEPADSEPELAKAAGSAAGQVADKTEAAGKAADKAGAAAKEAPAKPARKPAAANREPWAGYDDQTVLQIRKQLTGASARLTEKVRAYEQKHKNRQTILNLTAR